MADTIIQGGGTGPSIVVPQSPKSGEQTVYTEFTLADDTAVNFTPPWANGLVEFTDGSGLPANSGSAYFISGESPALVPQFAVAAEAVISGSGAFTVGKGSAVVLGTTALTGAVGTDARLNVAATGGKLYFENRLGSTKTIYVTVRRG